VTSLSLADSYLVKARVRLKTLPIFMEEQAYSDVVREAQEVVELACKAMLRKVGVEPPHWHDVGTLLREYRSRMPGVDDAALERVVAASLWLRKEREFSFYGDIDFIPTEQYSLEQGTKAVDDARFVVDVAGRVVREPVDGDSSPPDL
jgi:HEPN domain-containing protein